MPIARAEVDVERVSLWNSGTGGTRPLRSLWLTNTSGLTLDGGPFMVLESATFAGEGLVEPIKPGEKRLLSYAVDLGVQVESRNGGNQQAITRVRFERGIAVQQREQRSRVVYAVRNNDAALRTVVIEHPIHVGWTLASDATPSETTVNAYRFTIKVDAKNTATLTVDERRPVETRVAVVQMSDDQLTVLTRETGDAAALVSALAPIRAKKNEIATLAASQRTRDAETERIGQDQQRLRENMRSLKGSADEKALLQRYVTQLNAQEDRLAVVRRETTDVAERRVRAEAELSQFIASLSLDVTPATQPPR